MSRIERRFAELEAAQRKALVPFVTAGDPSLDATVPVMHALVEAGADVIELGVPFSDPMADGPTIQRSSERALRTGRGHASTCCRCVREFRTRDAHTPVVLMGYLNPVEIHGSRASRSARRRPASTASCWSTCRPRKRGVSATRSAARASTSSLLASPTTSPMPAWRCCARRARATCTTSASPASPAPTASTPARPACACGRSARAVDVPVVAGFGIKDAASAAAMAVDADGVVVGSALVARLAGVGNGAGAASPRAAFLAPLRAALDCADVQQRRLG